MVMTYNVIRYTLQNTHSSTDKYASLLTISRYPIFLQCKDPRLLHFSNSDLNQWNPLEQGGISSTLEAAYLHSWDVLSGFRRVSFPPHSAPYYDFHFSLMGDFSSLAIQSCKNDVECLVNLF